MITNGETHNTEPTHNHNHTSSLSVGHQAKNELARGPVAALQELSRVPNLAYSVAEASASADAPARRQTGTSGPRL